MTERLPRAGLLQLAGSVVLLASAWPITKAAISAGAVPLWFAFGRAACSALTAFALLVVLRRLRLPGRQDLPALLAVGALQLAAFFGLAHAAVEFVPAGRTTVLSNVTTIFVVPLSLLVLGEAIPLHRWLATGIALAGVVVLMGPWSINWSAPGVLLGHGYLLLAAASFACAIMAVRRYPPALTMFQLLPWCFTLASLLLLPVALSHPGGLGTWPSASRWSMLYIGGLAGPLGTWCAMQASSRLPVMVSSVGFLATPAAGLLFSLWWLGEPLTVDLLAGTALILFGVGLASRPAPARARA